MHSFFRTPSKNFSGVIVQGKSPWAHVPREISRTAVLRGYCSGWNYSGKNVRYTIAQGTIAVGRISWGAIVRGVIVQRETIQG